MSRAAVKTSNGGSGPAQLTFPGADKERYVRDMFAAIAPRYDLLNSLLSFNRDRLWRRLAVRAAAVRPGDRCLDICTGTGDLAIELARAAGPDGRVVGADFCEPMIRSGRHKLLSSSGGPIRMMTANAESLPYPENEFDVTAVGFGIRNVANIERAIKEMARVTKQNGRVVILEFTRPNPGPLKPIIDLYLFHILPRIGGLLSRKEAYRYLPESMRRFISRDQLLEVMERVGIQDIRILNLNFGTVCIHVGIKSASAVPMGAA